MKCDFKKALTPFCLISIKPGAACASLLADLFGQKTVVLRVIFSCLSLPAAHCISFSNQFHCCKSSFGYSTQFIWETFLISFSVMSIKEKMTLHIYQMSCGVNRSSLFKWLLLQNCMKINETTFFSLKLFHVIAVGPQKPQKLTG